VGGTTRGRRRGNFSTPLVRMKDDGVRLLQCIQHYRATKAPPGMSGEDDDGEEQDINLLQMSSETLFLQFCLFVTV